MKPHQEIRDAINLFKLPLGAGRDVSDEFSEVLDILHALNDRIEALEKLSEERWNQLQEAIIEIQDA